MSNGDFLTGLQNLTKWLGYLILPTLSALCVIIAIFHFSEKRPSGRYIAGALLCLTGPGCAMLLNYFTLQPSTTANVDGVTGALITAISYFGNVLMPIFAVLCFIRGIAKLGTPMRHFHFGADQVRPFIAGLASLMISGVTRLLEYFVTSSTQLQPGAHSMLIHAAEVARCHFA